MAQQQVLPLLTSQPDLGTVDPTREQVGRHLGQNRDEAVPALVDDRAHRRPTRKPATATLLNFASAPDTGHRGHHRQRHTLALQIGQTGLRRHALLTQWRQIGQHQRQRP